MAPSEEFRLPIEIVSRVFDFLVDSKPTLKACALVSRAFVPYAREKLFSGRLQLCSEQVKPFLKLCNSRYSTIRAVLPRIKKFYLVQHACGASEPWSLAGTAKNCDAFNQLLGWRRTCWNRKEKETMIALLTNVKVLKITSLCWEALGERARYALLTGFQRVIRMELQDVRFERTEDFSLFLSSFPRLIDIRLYSVGLVLHAKPRKPIRAPASANLPAFTNPPLRSLAEFSGSVEVVDALVPLSQSLSALGFSIRLDELCEGSSRMTSINRLLSSAGHTLEKLTICFESTHSLTDPFLGGIANVTVPFTLVNLAANTRIRHMYLSPARHLAQYLLPYLRCVADARSPSGREPRLEILEIPPLGDLVFNKKSFDWEALDEFLAIHWYFSNLTELRCSVTTEFYIEDVADQPRTRSFYWPRLYCRRPDKGSAAEARMAHRVRYIERRMPQCVAKGILKVTQKYTYDIMMQWMAAQQELASAQQLHMNRYVVGSPISRLRSAIKRVILAVKG